MLSVIHDEPATLRVCDSECLPTMLRAFIESGSIGLVAFLKEATPWKHHSILNEIKDLAVSLDTKFYGTLREANEVADSSAKQDIDLSSIYLDPVVISLVVVFLCCFPFGFWYGALYQVSLCGVMWSGIHGHLSPCQMF